MKFLGTKSKSQMLVKRYKIEGYSDILSKKVRRIEVEGARKRGTPRKKGSYCVNSDI